MSYATELARLQNELGITDTAEDIAGVGYIEDASVGAEGGRQVYGRPRIAVPAPGDIGDGVVWPLPLTAAVSLAAGATGTLTFTPNRNVSIKDVQLDVYVAAAAAAAIMPAAIKVTSINVQGRPQLAGTGEIPLSALRPINPQRLKLVMENCQAGQNITIGLINNDAATTHVVTGVIWVVTVK